MISILCYLKTTCIEQKLKKVTLAVNVIKLRLNSPARDPFDYASANTPIPIYRKCRF